jgi:hypothetical protein
MAWQEGSEIVYDFATMERARFTYQGVPPEKAQEDSPVKGVNISLFEVATTWYAINLNGFENEEGLIVDYSGRFASFGLGVSTPVFEVGGGIVTVWSPGFDVTGIGHFQMAGGGPGGLGASVDWTSYSIAEPENNDLPIRYDTGGIVLKRDYKRMRNDIVTGAHVPPHPNETSPLFPRVTMLRQLAARELDFVWRSYYAPLLDNYHSPMR